MIEIRGKQIKTNRVLEYLYLTSLKHNDKTALQIENNGSMIKYTFNDLRQRSVDISSFLIRNGIEKGDRIAIFSENRPEWAITLFGAMSAGAVTVPVDCKLSREELKFIINSSKSKVLFVSGNLIPEVLAVYKELKTVNLIVCLDDNMTESVISFDDIRWSKGNRRGRMNQVSSDDTALIVYTSGTTGVAKGVEITYNNLIFEVTELTKIIHFSEKNHLVSILPLNHTFEITAGLLGPLFSGASISYTKSIRLTNLASLMKKVKCTDMICVPLILKMFHDGIFREVQNIGKIKQKLFFIMLEISKFLFRYNIRIGRLFFKDIRNKFGGHLNSLMCGGAPLDPQVELNLNALGIQIFQGYGLTETSPVISINTDQHHKFGSVGKPVPGVKVKILKTSETHSSEGEILVNGPNVMKGYFREPEKTSEVIRNEWFYTGDIGYIDKDGYLFISGRLKNLIVLGAGKKVFPEEVEQVMRKSIYIKEICVYGAVAQTGSRKGYEVVNAVIVPSIENIPPELSNDNDKIRALI
ncbi:MAG: AMP-dependent synthetase/ligase, partial [Candidatus Muiribacteriaceae bacterium]